MTEFEEKPKRGINIETLFIEESLNNMNDEQLLGIVNKFDESARRRARLACSFVFMASKGLTGYNRYELMEQLASLQIPDELLEELDVDRKVAEEAFQDFFEFASMKPDLLERFKNVIDEIEGFNKL